MDNGLIYKTCADKRTTPTRMRCRTPSASVRERSQKIDKEMNKANQVRLVKEVERNKILINDLSLEKPKPASYYITKAKASFAKKNESKDYSPSIIDRKRMFGPMLSKSIMHKSERAKSADGYRKIAHENIKDSVTEDKVLPEWLVERPDYQIVARKLSNLDGNIADICLIPPNSRNDDEKKSFFNWLLSARFFNKLTTRVIKETCDKLTRVKFKENEYLMKKGDIGDCLYIIFSGRAQVIIEPGSVHDILGAKSVIGEHALDTSKNRTASVLAIEPIIAFKLTKLDYDQILLNVKKLEKYKNSKLLMSIPFFHNWSFLKVQHLSNFLIKKNFKKGEILYDKGQESDTFYIIKKGQVDIQAYVDMQQINRWPTGSKQWKILEINKKYIITIASLNKGNYFGETTLIDQMPRICRAICVVETVCLTINKDEFFETFSVKDLELLQEQTYAHVPKDKELQEKLVEEIEEKAKNVWNM